MTKRLSARGKVIQAEKDAEKAYQAHLQQAAIHARTLAEDEARTETQRLAAAEAETALRVVEEARKRAEQEHPAEVKKTFWTHLTSWLTGY